MAYTTVVINKNLVHICEVGPKNEPGRVVQVLTGMPARQAAWQIEKEIKAAIGGGE